jgi:hypothetical protein
MDESGASIVEAKKLYTKQLTELFTPYIYQGMTSIFMTCIEEANTLKTFQEKMCSVVRWNQDIIDKEYSRIISTTDDSFLKGLIDAVFVSNVKVLSSIRISKNKKINIKIPDPKIFVHKCYIECARQLYQDPYLLDNRLKNNTVPEIQKNVKKTKILIGVCIEKTIRDLIPIQNIIENYITESNDSESESISDTYENPMMSNNSEPELEIKEEDPFLLPEQMNNIIGPEEKSNPEIQVNEVNDSFLNESDRYKEDSIDEKIPDLEVSGGSIISETPNGFVNKSVNDAPNDNNTVNNIDFFSDTDSDA